MDLKNHCLEMCQIWVNVYGGGEAIIVYVFWRTGYTEGRGCPRLAKWGGGKQ